MIRYIFLILISFDLFAIDPECAVDVSSTATALAASLNGPSCVINKSREEINRSLSKKKPRESFCKNCINPIYSSGYTSREEITNRQKKIAKASFNELRKTLIKTMNDLMSMRSSFEMEFSTNLPVEKCNIQAIQNKPCFKNKISTLLSGDEFEVLKKQLAVEARNLANPTFEQKEGLMLREREPDSCNISDREVNFSRIKYAESLLTPSFFKELKTKKLETETDIIQAVNEVLKNNFNNDILKSHPMFSAMKQNPAEFKSFINSVNDNSTPKVIIQNLYANNAGAFANSIASSCESAFAELENKLCNSQPFDDGNLVMDGPESLNFIEDVNLATSPIEDVDSSLKRLCEDVRATSNKSKPFFDPATSFNKSLPEVIRYENYDQFKGKAYKYYLNESRDALCAIKNSKEKCNPSDPQCQMYGIISKSKTEGTPEYNIINAHDNNVDSILRSLIGTPKGLSKETTQILISEGLLSNSNGKFEIQKDIPERKSKAQSKNLSSRETSQTFKNEKTIQETKTEESKSQQTRVAQESDSNSSDVVPETILPELRPNSPDFNPTKYAEEMSRRLKQGTSKLPQTTQTIQAPESSKTPIISNDDISIPTSISGGQAQVPTTNFFMGSNATAEISAPTVTDKDSKAKIAEERRTTMNGAMVQAAEAKEAAASGRTPASTTSEIQASASQTSALGSVALSINSDAENLDQLLTAKVNSNDIEAQELKRKMNASLATEEDFLIKLSGISVKVSYSKEKNAFHVAYASGDQDKAKRLIPRLESFFNSKKGKADLLRATLSKG